MKRILFSLIVLLSLFACKKTEQETNPNLIQQAVDPLASFQGYKVHPQAKLLGTEYWENTEVLMDLMVVAYQTPYGSRNRYNTFLIQMACGDFNNDGWIDIFNPGASYNGIQGGMTFLIWNPTKKIFEEQNLFKDQSIKSFDGNKVKTIPIYFNGDDYVDMVLITAEDESNFTYAPKKIKLLISDGQGKYEITDITHMDPEISATSGDVGDLNGDKIPDLVLTSGSWFKILWGTNSPPYFKISSIPLFTFPIVNLIGGTIVTFINDNGFGEKCPSCIENSVNDVSITDINKDGRNDLVLQQTELRDDVNNTEFNKILLNQGNGKFNESGIIKLPKFENNTNRPVSQEDYQFDDLNGDGKMDIIALNQVEYKTWNIFVYLQNSSGGFEIKKDWIQYTINNPRKGFWKSNLIYRDFNNDGLKDITYLDDGDNGETKYKSVFIRKGNQFVEEDIYKYDPYAKSVMSKIKY
jgi:hypothetical protein